MAHLCFGLERYAVSLYLFAEVQPILRNLDAERVWREDRGSVDCRFVVGMSARGLRATYILQVNYYGKMRRKRKAKFGEKFRGTENWYSQLLKYVCIFLKVMYCFGSFEEYQGEVCFLR